MVDIIIPVYNVAPYLRQCLNSVLRQTYTDIHIIIVDDGSTDGSSDICNDYSKLKNVTLIKQKNSGLSAARNTGLTYATAPYLMFIDSDDWIEPNTVEILMNSLSENNADIACGRTCMEYKTRSVSTTSGSGKTFICNQEQALDEVLSKNIIGYSAWGKLYKRSLFNNVIFPIGRTHEDIPITPKVILNCQKVIVVDIALFHYRQQNNSLSRGLYNVTHRDLYIFNKENHYIIDIYPSLKDSYFVSYYTSLKDLLTLFKNRELKKMYSKDYTFYRRELYKNLIHILCNKKLSVPAKLSIISILIPFRNLIKRIIKHR